MAGWRMDDVITMEHIFKMVRRQKELNFDPGEEHMYCNTGYTLLAEIVSRVSGMSFPEFTKKYIFEPLGMNNTHFHDDHELIVPNRTYSYKLGKEGVFKKSILSYANVGATSLFTTVRDLALWLANLEDGKIGGPDIRDLIQRPGTLNSGDPIEYAFGLLASTHKGLKIVEHSGGDAGFRSHTIRFPSEKLGIIVLSNNAALGAQELALKVADVLLKKTINEKAPSGIKLDLETLNRYVGKYTLPLGIATVYIKDNKLFADAVGTTIELVPTSETEFYLPKFDGKGVFQDFKGGKAQKFVVNALGQTIPGGRVEDITLTPEGLHEYEGAFYSEELDTSYYFEDQDGTLTMKHRRHNNVPIIPVSEDEFVMDTEEAGLKIKFTRGVNNSVLGFLATTGRVRNLKFIKK